MRRKNLTMFVLAMLAVAGGCVAAAGVGEPGVGEPGGGAFPVALDTQRPNLAEVGALRFRGAIELPDGGGVGGLSGLWVSGDGGRFLAISDNGRTLTGRLSYDAAGRLVGAGDFTARDLPLDERKGRTGRMNDSEEVARLADGSWLVSFERNHRILRYRSGPERPEGEPAPLPTPPGLEDAPPNGGPEAMAALADGRLLVIEEGADDGVVERRAWIGKAGLTARGDWQALTYRTAPRFRPAGAAALPDGGALVLERYVSLLGGWASRIVHVPADALRPGAVIDGVELARLERPLLVDNFEGIAVRPAPNAAGPNGDMPTGDMMVYIVSDDNRSALQRTYMMMFELPAKALKPAVARR